MQPVWKGIDFMPMSFWDSVGKAASDFAYFNTTGNALNHLENLNSGGEFSSRPMPKRKNSLLDFIPSSDETRDTDPPSSARIVSRSPLKPETIDYINAEYAKHYGMDSATAYQEALSNTSYQRAVADMQAAGLNPSVIFGAGRGSGADSFSGRVVSSGSRGSRRRKVEEDSFGLGDSAALIGSATEFFTQLFTGKSSLARTAGNTAKALVQTVDKALSK